MVHKSQGGKLQVYVDVPDNASLYQRESMGVIPDSHMMVAIGKYLIYVFVVEVSMVLLWRYKDWSEGCTG